MMRFIAWPTGLAFPLTSTFRAVLAAMFLLGPISVCLAQPLQANPYTPSLDLASMDRAANPCIDFYLRFAGMTT